MSHEYTPKHEKNWPMFEYNGTLLFITSIQPLRVIVPVPHPNEALYQKTGINFGHTVSFSGATDYCWNFGTARGGTPALRVGDEYLAFFHSNVKRDKAFTNISTTQRIAFKIIKMIIVTLVQ